MTNGVRSEPTVIKQRKPIHVTSQYEELRHSKTLYFLFIDQNQTQDAQDLNE